MSDNDVLKIVVLGEGRVGKTSLLMKYFNKKFNEGQKTTINPTFFEKTINYKGKDCHFKFWDTVGQEQFDAITKIYYQNAIGALLVYDVTIFETFEKVEKWVRTLKEVVGNDITFLIAGNKIDLTDKNKLIQYSSTIDSYCSKENCKHIYTSAKNGYNVDEAFENLINDVLTKININNPSANNQRKGKRLEIGKVEEEKEKKKGCCSK